MNKLRIKKVVVNVLFLKKNFFKIFIIFLIGYGIFFFVSQTSGLDYRLDNTTSMRSAIIQKACDEHIKKTKSLTLLSVKETYSSCSESERLLMGMEEVNFVTIAYFICHIMLIYFGMVFAQAFCAIFYRIAIQRELTNVVHVNKYYLSKGMNRVFILFSVPLIIIIIFMGVKGVNGYSTYNFAEDCVYKTLPLLYRKKSLNYSNIYNRSAIDMIESIDSDDLVLIPYYFQPCYRKKLFYSQSEILVYIDSVILMILCSLCLLYGALFILTKIVKWIYAGFFIDH